MGHGRRIKLSNGRKLVDDVIRIGNRTPLASLVRELDVSVLGSLRRRVSPRISWSVLMMKAYGIVCHQRPELRRMYVSLPWPHFYEYDKTVCMITMSRAYQGEERLFFARFNQPEEHSLRQLQDQYDHLRRAPIEEIPQFVAQVRFARAPRFVRRFAWWWLYNLWPQKRATHMGTFGMSLSGFKNAYGTQLLGPNTTSIGIDPVPRRGISKFLFTFDHRVIDGVPAADTIESFRFQLSRSIIREMKDLLIKQGDDPELVMSQDKTLQSRLRASA